MLKIYLCSPSTSSLLSVEFYDSIESKHVAHVSIVVDVRINCCVRLLHLVPILLYFPSPPLPRHFFRLIATKPCKRLCSTTSCSNTRVKLWWWLLLPWTLRVFKFPGREIWIPSACLLSGYLTEGFQHNEYFWQDSGELLPASHFLETSVPTIWT